LLLWRKAVHGENISCLRREVPVSGFTNEVGVKSVKAAVVRYSSVKW